MLFQIALKFMTIEKGLPTFEKSEALFNHHAKRFIYERNFAVQAQKNQLMEIDKVACSSAVAVVNN